jgi:serine/threonine protein phosphatase 1
LVDILTNVEDLPHVYVVGEGADRFHIVHAELPLGVTDEDIDAGLPRTFRPVECLTWSRRIMGAESWPVERATSPGLSPTYCGHTPGKSVRQRDSHVCLDLGTFATGRVAVAEPQTGGIEVVEP